MAGRMLNSLLTQTGKQIHRLDAYLASRAYALSSFFMHPVALALLLLALSVALIALAVLLHEMMVLREAHDRLSKAYKELTLQLNSERASARSAFEANLLRPANAPRTNSPATRTPRPRARSPIIHQNIAAASASSSVDIYQLANAIPRGARVIIVQGAEEETATATPPPYAPS